MTIFTIARFKEESNHRLEINSIYENYALDSYSFFIFSNTKI
ncbi:hypothetical protein SAMN04488062_11776 [Flavobacterium omnivorum]|uniref:Uncharacterized protein n=1 Tax=Flavobacterium omnivorum TaxID=178355 RepID=A0A1G8GAP3_9FLAO|nr:hypothetical protein SAMN04488062_11776 [Flavobacterium omnivorum]